MEIQCKGFSVSFPYDVDDKLNQFEMQAKGCLSNTILKLNSGIEYEINFYDSTRFKQDVDEEVKIYGLFYEENVVLIEEITKEKLLYALNKIFDGGLCKKMVPVNCKE